MKIWDGMIQDYLSGRSLAEYRETWYFETSSPARDAGRNIFEAPEDSEDARRQVETVYRELLAVCGDFIPFNREIWDVLFPNWQDALADVQVDLVVGFPNPYDAMVTTGDDGLCHVIFDLRRWTAYLGHGSMETMAKNLMTHELCHVLLHEAVPGLDAAYEADYRTALDAIAFNEGFAHLVSFQASLGEVDWDAAKLRDVREKSAETLRKALSCQDEAEQKDYLYSAQCGSYYDKFACMAGMLYLAELWRKGGAEALKTQLEAGYHGFAEQCSKG